jgi:hypothetical protein
MYVGERVQVSSVVRLFVAGKKNAEVVRVQRNGHNRRAYLL